MKKLINTVLGLIFMVMYVVIEFYPTIKMGAKIYVKNLDFNSLLNSEHVTKYVSYLSDEEKNELIEMAMTYCNNALD